MHLGLASTPPSALWLLTSSELPSGHRVTPLVLSLPHPAVSQVPSQPGLGGRLLLGPGAQAPPGPLFS